MMIDYKWYMIGYILLMKSNPLLTKYWVSRSFGAITSFVVTVWVLEEVASEWVRLELFLLPAMVYVYDY